MTTQESELQYTGRMFGGILNDIKRKAPHYKNDFRDAVHSSVGGATLFLFVAALANAIAFGALTVLLTGNQIGTSEMLVVTAVGGILFAMLSAQPLTILGGTGPITIFTGMLYIACRQFEIPFLATYAWVGIWSGIILLVCAITDTWDWPPSMVISSLTGYAAGDRSETLPENTLHESRSQKVDTSVYDRSNPVFRSAMDA